MGITKTSCPSSSSFHPYTEALQTLTNRGSQVTSSSAIFGNIPADVFAKLHTNLGLEQKNQFGLTPFMSSIYSNHITKAKSLLENGANPFIRDEDGNTALQVFADYGQVGKLIELFKLTPLTQLHQAEADKLLSQAKDSASVINSLKKRTVNLNLEEKQQKLINRVQTKSKNSQEQKELALEALTLIFTGADVNFVDNQGKTPLHHAALGGEDSFNPYMIKALVLAGANINATARPTGRTALHYAADDGHPDLLKILILAGANVDQSTPEGITPMQDAILGAEFVGEEHGLKMVEMLIKAGADMSIPDEEGITPFRLADKMGFQKIKKLLHSNIQMREGELKGKKKQIQRILAKL